MQTISNKSLANKIINANKKRSNKMKITHWTIKITQEDGAEEYLSDIPDWVAKNVDEYLTELEA